MNNKYKNKVFHVISNTHWDREWRFSFQRNRQMLVDMIDAVINILESEPNYKAFHLDSQSIVLKDYLEIKPQNKNKLETLIKNNRLLVGPWYILPEEFQVGGENLIRNLLLGHKISNEFGKVSKIGYSPFSWGQISQLPQIYKEFGIDLIMFYRGINSIDSPKAEFMWVGADGTHAVSSRFSTMPRYNFYFYIYRPVLFNEDFNTIEYKWNRNGTPFHFADKEQFTEDYFLLTPNDTYYENLIESSADKIINDQVDDFTTPHIIWMEGHDSSGPNIKTVKIINDIKLKFPGIDVRHSTLEDYANLVLKSVNKNNLKKVYSERRSSQYDLRSGNLYGYTTSARMYLKQKNYEAEKWLQFYAEPFNSVSGILGRDINDKYLEIAWELLIQNSAHDSIGGCSLDSIHEDMMNRYKHVIEISKGVFERSIKHIIKNISTKQLKENNDDIFLAVINPSTFKRNEIVEAFIDVPASIDKGSIKIINSNKEDLIFQLIEVKKVQPVLEQMINRPMYFDMIRYHVYLLVNNVSPFGYKTLKVIPVSKSNIKIKKLIASKNILENNHLRVKINSNGTFDLIDKENKLSFSGLGYIYDEGEEGHAWIHKSIKPFISTLKSKPKISLIENGELKASIKISHQLLLPISLNERRKKKPANSKVKVDLILSITKISKHVELKIFVNNTVESHRLRIMFPTKLNAKYSFGEGQFDVVKRTTERPDTHNWVEQPMYDFPMHHFVDISNENLGIAVFANGLKEYEILDDKESSLAITLLRSFENVIAPSSKQDFSDQKGSQCLGKHEYKIGIYPHKYNWQRGNVFMEAINFSNELRLAQFGNSNGNLPLELSFIKASSQNIQFSCFKKSESDNSFIVRVYNPTEITIRSTLEFFNKVEKAERVTLEEKSKEKITITNDNQINLTLKKKQIETLKIYFKELYD